MLSIQHDHHSHITHTHHTTILPYYYAIKGPNRRSHSPHIPWLCYIRASLSMLWMTYRLHLTKLITSNEYSTWSHPITPVVPSHITHTHHTTILLYYHTINSYYTIKGPNRRSHSPHIPWHPTSPWHLQNSESKVWHACPQTARYGHTRGNS